MEDHSSNIQSTNSFTFSNISFPSATPSNEPTTTTSFLSSYKSRGKSDQERRREELLEKQKQKRQDTRALARKIVIKNEDEDSHNPESKMEESTSSNVETVEAMVVETAKPTISKAERRQISEQKRAEFYKRQFMAPENMTEVPNDLIANWVCVPCPAGTQRCMVITNAGVTTARLASDGSIISRFTSDLPNGSLRQKASPSVYCILDCLFQQQSSTFFVLDVLAWNGCLYYDCGSDFRFFWMNSKLGETNCHQVSSHNPFRFVALPFYTSDSQGVTNAVQSTSTFQPFQNIQLDGILFYNKETHYTPGPTPLVCYLPISSVVTTLTPYFQSVSSN